VITTTTYTSVREHIGAVTDEMNGRFISRRDEIEGLWLGLLTRQNLLMVGPPGTAKTKGIEMFCSYTGLNQFSWLMTPFTVPEEILGPVSIKGLQEDKWKRIIEGKLPTAQLVHLDEGFKANSAILNALLRVLNERKFQNDGTEITVPMMLAIISSNEMPTATGDKASETLAAFADRFLLRYYTGYLEDDGFHKLMEQVVSDRVTPWTPQVKPIEFDDIITAQNEVAALTVDTDATESIEELRTQLNSNGMVLSDRRYAQLVSVMAAHAWLRGESTVTSANLEVANHILWNKPDDVNKLRTIVSASVNIDQQRAAEVLEAADESMKAIRDSKALGNIPYDLLINTLKEIHDMKDALGEQRQVRPVIDASDKLTSYLAELTTIATA
jgi:MoxR-like ATPase